MRQQHSDMQKEAFIGQLGQLLYSTRLKAIGVRGQGGFYLYFVFLGLSIFEAVLGPKTGPGGVSKASRRPWLRFP